MSKKLKKSGQIQLFSKNLEYVTRRIYKNPLERNHIIEKWKKIYPNRSFFIQIKPEIYED
jgi:hypothetical protein